MPLRIHSSAIRYFDAVRRAQSIREAARQLNVASSAVNRLIIKLEEEIGEPLFHRLPSGLVLTPIGEALARHVITVFQDLERTGAEIMAPGSATSPSRWWRASPPRSCPR